MELTNKLVVITGAGRGLGRAMALTFAQQGAQLALLDITTTDVQQTQALCTAQGIRCRTYSCNVAVEAEVETTFAQLVQDFGRLDILINNAGILRDGLLVKKIPIDTQNQPQQPNHQIKKMSLEQWQSVIDVNLTGTFLCGREAAMHMIQGQHAGLIINLSSIARAGNIGQSNYAAAKAGVAALTVTWARELARYSIRVAAIAPGMIGTEMIQAMPTERLKAMLQHIPLQRTGEPEEVAQAALFIAQNDYFSGRIVELDAGLRL